jgi:hypothetical protein
VAVVTVATAVVMIAALHLRVSLNHRKRKQSIKTEIEVDHGTATDENHEKREHLRLETEKTRMNDGTLQKIVAVIPVIEDGVVRNAPEEMFPKDVAAVRTRDTLSENAVEVAHDNLLACSN